MIQTEDNYQQINAEAEEKDDDSILNFYKKLIALRKEMPVISEGKIQFMDEDNLDVQNGKLKLRAKQKRQRVLCLFVYL